MRELIYEQEWAKTAPNLELYYMYRGVKKRGDLRYDLTLIPSRMLGKEFIKTKGNRNSKNFQELYIVLKGKAIFLMQKMQKGVVKDVLAVKAGEKNSVIIPPQYAVITINPSKENLKIGNWVSEKNKNVYEELEKKGGACYYYTKSGWIKNKNYDKVPPLRFEKPFKSLPKNLNFLK